MVYNDQIDVRRSSDIPLDTVALNSSVADFVGFSKDYYQASFRRILTSASWRPMTFNLGALILGPIWPAMRGIWGLFWMILLLETFAWVQVGRGAWGDLGRADLMRAHEATQRAKDFADRAAAAAKGGGDSSQLAAIADNLKAVAEHAREASAVAATNAIYVLVLGLGLLAITRLIQAVLADRIYERQFEQWRIDPVHVDSGIKGRNLTIGLFAIFFIIPVTVYKFTSGNSVPLLNSFPADAAVANAVSVLIEQKIDTMSITFSGVSTSMVAVVNSVLNSIVTVLIGTPWMVVMAVIVALAWRASGYRLAIFSALCLGYLGYFGYWQLAMETVALVGAAVMISLAIGIPLGIIFGRSFRSHTFAEPVLDLMQTLPAFVYLIPIVAFFGTGNAPGVLATIIFGAPPVIRLTALGIRNVSPNVKEAALAFGATRWQLLRGVELPLALPSILTGVNQTILMCLSMTVVVSLIGGGGLGKVILEALQYAAKGPGIMGGLAILFVAMVMDRLVQGMLGGRRK